MIVNFRTCKISWDTDNEPDIHVNLKKIQHNCIQHFEAVTTRNKIRDDYRSLYILLVCFNSETESLYRIDSKVEGSHVLLIIINKTKGFGGIVVFYIVHHEINIVKRSNPCFCVWKYNLILKGFGFFIFDLYNFIF